MTSVPVVTTPTFSPGNPTKLFGVQSFVNPTGRTYDVSPDDQRFLMIKTAAGQGSSPTITVVENWIDELKARVSAK